MLTSKRIMKVFAVFALVVFMGTTALTSTIEAATPPPARQSQGQRPPQGNPGNRPSMQQRPQHDNRPQPRRQAPPPPSRNNERRRNPERYRRHDDRDSHSDTGNLVTGLIIGGVIGAIIANNT